MRTIEQIEDDLDAAEPQPDSWAIELGILLAAAMIAAMAIGGTL